jgi:predicted cupin superfamily sugar epimerase
MLVGSQFSTIHRLRSDELWCHHLGAPLSIHLLTIEEGHTEITLGTDLEKGHRPQVVVPAGTWFGAKVRNSEGFSLAGCIMAPGFEFRDLEIGDREELIRSFPDQRSIIEELTK